MDVELQEKLMRQLQQHEGSIKDKEGWHLCYKCSADKLTIGYGHNLNDWPIIGIDCHSRLTEEEACHLLRQDMEKVYKQVRNHIPFLEELDCARRAVLVNMAFNMGIKSLCGFKNTLKCIENGDYVAASINMLQSKWATQVGKRSSDLAEQMRTGQWV